MLTSGRGSPASDRSQPFFVGTGRSCHGGALPGHPAGVYIWASLRRVLGLLDRTCCHSTAASVCSAYAHSCLFWPPFPSGRAGVWGVGRAGRLVVVAGDVVEVLAVGAPPLCLHHGVLPGPPFITPGPGASPCGPSRLLVASLARPPCLLVPLQGSTQFSMDYTSRRSRLGPGGLGALLQHYGPDTYCRPRVDRRLGCYLPHHPGPWYTLFCSPSFLSPFVHHGRQ